MQLAAGPGMKLWTSQCMAQSINSGEEKEGEEERTTRQVRNPQVVRSGQVHPTQLTTSCK